MKSSFKFLPGLTLFFILACNALAPVPTVVPSLIPATVTTAPLLSRQVVLSSQSIEETNQTPPFTIKAQIPQLGGSEDARVALFNQRLNEIVTDEVDVWRKSFSENTFPTVSNGSFLEVSPTLVSQIGELWSFKFDFHFYSDGAAHPGTYSITVNHDLARGKELMLGDLFLPNSNYLEVVANYCKMELSKQPFFEGPFSDGANPTVENYRNWNITADGLLITFDEYQVAPYAAGPQVIRIPVDAIRTILDPAGPLVGMLP